jgi:anti-anti-sigma regulatory factor
MLRLTVEDLGTALLLKLQGRLAGVWVPELAQSWRTLTARSPGTVLMVDLTHTDFVDLAGKYLLCLMHQAGVRLSAHSPHMMAVVAEIVG